EGDRPQCMGAVSHVRGDWEGRVDLYVYSSGVVGVPIDQAVIKADKESLRTSSQVERILQQEAVGWDQLRELPGAMSWPIAEIVGGDVAGRLRVTLRLDLADGSSVSMKTSTESEFVADPASFVSAFRFVTAPEPVGAATES